LNVSVVKITKLVHATSIVFFAILISSIAYIAIKGLDSFSSAMFLTFIYLSGITLGVAGKIKEHQKDVFKILVEWFIACVVGILLFIIVFFFL